jgi:hypothetical protein
MFRKLLGLALVAVIAGAFSTAAVAAPVAGSFTLDIVIAPQCADLVPDFAGVTYDNPGCDKIDDTVVKLEADLILTLSVSGLDITSTTVFTFKGLESQVFTVAGTVGALTFKDTFVFAPSLVEIEFVRNSIGSVRYCVNYSTPGDITPPFLDCPSADAVLFFMLEDVGVFHPAFANLYLGGVFDAAGMLDAPLELAKKIVDLSINIAGLTITARSLFANFQTGQQTTNDTWNTGVVLGLEGQTVSGITLRSETWIGARQGLECWGECKPLERNYGGKVVPGFTAQEEKIFIRNLVFAGITNNIRIEFKFGQPNPASNGLSYVEWNQRYRLTPFGGGLSISNTLRMNGNLDPIFDFLITSYKFGDMSVTAVWYIYPSTNDWEARLAEFVTTFDPPGATVTSDLILCTEQTFTVFCTGGVFEHGIYISAAVGSMTFDMAMFLTGLVSGFYEAWLDIGWKIGNVNLKASLDLLVDGVQVVAFQVNVRF